MSLILEALKKSEQARQSAGPILAPAASRHARPSSRRRLGTGVGILTLTLVTAAGIWWFWMPGEGSHEGAVEEIVQAPVPEHAVSVSVPLEPGVAMEDERVDVPDEEPDGSPGETADTQDEPADEDDLVEDLAAPEPEDQMAESTPQDDMAGSTETQADPTAPPTSQPAVHSSPEAPLPSPAAGPEVGMSSPEPASLPAQEPPEAKSDAGEAVIDLRGFGRTARAAKTDESLPTLDQLPYETKQRVLPLSLEVHVYDERSARRFVMINGKLLNEGGEVKAGLRVDAISQEGVVLVWEGRRFLVKPGG